MLLIEITLLLAAVLAIALLALAWRHPVLAAYVGVPLTLIAIRLIAIAPAPVAEPVRSCMPSMIGNLGTFDLTDLARPAGLLLLAYAAAWAAVALASRCWREVRVAR